jgi:hypothetical protein
MWRIAPGQGASDGNRAVGFNRQCMLTPIGNIPSAEAEERYYAMLNGQKLAA